MKTGQILAKVVTCNKPSGNVTMFSIAMVPILLASAIHSTLFAAREETPQVIILVRLIYPILCEKITISLTDLIGIQEVESCPRPKPI